ncbi:MAG: leucyl/phenylalanyl-tRNA--protein transferase [Burkholderiaceae bacterium]|jgi:leucyl/phenylalanyl-tRNA--protein transferase|nr:leucyl/phenylalanyl-tRNA--protein transferase [Burkholderiaceae bacterium]
MIPWLRPGEPFPPVTRALRNPNGLLCAAVDLDADRLVQAYLQGIFPWYAPGEPVLWWSPDPRMVLMCEEFSVSRSLRKKLRAAGQADDGRGWQVRLDTAFTDVMRACAQPRPGQEGTWITSAVLAAYGELHARGLAHSVEVWDGPALIGGLYGVSLGRMFYGESMFTRASDASKVALAALVRLLLESDVPLIDCQQNTSHLASLGGREIPRTAFRAHLARTTGAAPVDWQRYAAGPLNRLLLAY